MATSQPATSARLSRRSFLGAGLALGATTTLAAACGGGSSAGSGGGAKTLKFWDMPWGSPAYNTAGKKLTEAYAPAAGLPGASYQIIQWNNFVQTFSSAIVSSTGPAVSSGGGFQAFQFAAQGAIAYADNVVATFQKDGTLDDFLPGVIENMKTDKGYAAIPWQLDLRVWWYRKSILDSLGLQPPTTWDELLTVGKALAKKGYYGFGVGAGAGDNLGAHAMICMMINNGGGLFNPAGELDLVTDRNIEAMAFVRELANEKIIDPAAVSYTIDNETTQWKSKKFAVGINTPGLDNVTGDASGDLLVMGPMAGPHGDKGSLMFVNNIMMYRNTPSQQGSEAFVEYYIKNMKTYWEQNVDPAIPALKSIVALPAFQQQTQKLKVVSDWQPICKSYASLSNTLSPALAQIDGGQPLSEFTQRMLQGKTDPKTALQTLETALKAIVK
ncbi:MAG TPA: extracellular solute-binding protein [Rugosimonospora sp.]|nr:extracellular solute-binding protein [Rugosimonospora sp.]